LTISGNSIGGAAAVSTSTAGVNARAVIATIADAMTVVFADVSGNTIGGAAGMSVQASGAGATAHVFILQLANNFSVTGHFACEDNMISDTTVLASGGGDVEAFIVVCLGRLTGAGASLSLTGGSIVSTILTASKSTVCRGLLKSAAGAVSAAADDHLVPAPSRPAPSTPHKMQYRPNTRELRLRALLSCC
jgi:hypothetical protein